eukprot:SAG22_NODE_925_length_6469_cov_3.836264_4_plen_134_part_00
MAHFTDGVELAQKLSTAALADPVAESLVADRPAEKVNRSEMLVVKGAVKGSLQLTARYVPHGLVEQEQEHAHPHMMAYLAPLKKGAEAVTRVERIGYLEIEIQSCTDLAACDPGVMSSAAVFTGSVGQRTPLS